MFVSIKPGHPKKIASCRFPPLRNTSPERSSKLPRRKKGRLIIFLKNDTFFTSCCLGVDLGLFIKMFFTIVSVVWIFGASSSKVLLPLNRKSYNNYICSDSLVLLTLYSRKLHNSFFSFLHSPFYFFLQVYL